VTKAAGAEGGDFRFVDRGMHPNRVPSRVKVDNSSSTQDSSRPESGVERSGGVALESRKMSSGRNTAWCRTIRQSIQEVAAEVPGVGLPVQIEQPQAARLMSAGRVSSGAFAKIQTPRWSTASQVATK
jgi:phosphatidate phosphatase APP1